MSARAALRRSIARTVPALSHAAIPLDCGEPWGQQWCVEVVLSRPLTSPSKEGQRWRYIDRDNPATIDDSVGQQKGHTVSDAPRSPAVGRHDDHKVQCLTTPTDSDGHSTQRANASSRAAASPSKAIANDREADAVDGERAEPSKEHHIETDNSASPDPPSTSRLPKASEKSTATEPVSAKALGKQRAVYSELSLTKRTAREDGKHAKPDRDGKRKRNKAKARERDSDESGDDLRSNLNADAFARSTAPNNRKDFQSRLQKLKLAREGKGRPERSDDDSSASSTDSGSSSRSSSIVSSDGFVVSDDSESEFKKSRKGKKSLTGTARSGKKARRSSPPLDAAFLRPQGRMDLDEACKEFNAWIVSQLFGEHQDSRTAEIMSKARKRLQEYVNDSLGPIQSASMRRQFNWYLRRYPTIRRLPLFTNEVKDFRGCAACHRKSQKCESRIIFGGKPYKKDTLEWLDLESDVEDSSDMSTGVEDVIEHQHPDIESQIYKSRLPLKATKQPKKHVCFLGAHCAARAVLLHAGFHWQYGWLNKVAKDPRFLALRNKRSSGHKSYKDIEFLASQLSPAIKETLNQIRHKAVKLAGAR